MGNVAGSRVGRGTILIFLGKIGGFLVMPLQVVLIPKVLGPENMGFYSYWLSVFFILGTVFDLGGFQLLSRYLPEYWACSPSSVRPLLRGMVAVKVPVIALALGAGLFFFKDSAARFLIVGLGAVFFAFNWLLSAVFYTRQEMGKHSLLTFARTFFRLLLVPGLFLAMDREGVPLGIMGGALLAFLLFVRSAYRCIPPDYGALARPVETYFSFGAWVFLGGLFSILTKWAVVALSERQVQDLAQIGYLGLGLQISLFAGQFVSSVGESLFPSLIVQHTQADERFRKTMELTWKYTNLILLPLMVGILVLLEPGLKFLIGKAFLPGTTVMQLLLPSAVFFCWGLVHRQVLYAFEAQRKIFMKACIEFVVFLPACWYLIRKSGIIGAPIAVSLGLLAGYAYAYAATARLTRIDRYFGAVLKPLLASALMGFALRGLPINSAAGLLGAVFIGVLLYLAAVLVMRGVDTQDLQRLKAVFVPHSG